MKIHTGDTVVVITGKDKGKTGTVVRVLPESSRVVVQGINMRVKHIRKTAQKAGERISFEASLHASNVMLVDPKTKKRTRVGYKIEESGKKVRFSKRSGDMVKTISSVKAKDSKKKKKAVEAAEALPEGQKVDAKSPAAAAAPFWKKMGFGSRVGQQVGEQGAAVAEKDMKHAPTRHRSQEG